MAEDIGNLAIKLSIDSAKFEQSMASIDRNLKAMGQEMRGLQNHGNAWGQSTAGLTSKQDALSRMLSGQQTKVERLRAAYDASKAATGENSVETERLAIQLNRATAEYNRTEAELAQVAAALQRQRDELRLSESSWTQLGERMRAVGAVMSNVGKEMTKIGKNMSMKVTAPIMLVGTLATKAAVEFESSFAGIRKTVTATEEEFAELEKGIRDMAKSGPTAATELAAIGESAGQLGIETKNILAFTSTVSDIAVATNMTAEQAATDFARFANITKMPQTEFDKLGSSIVALGNNFATTESEIMGMAMRLAGAGAQVGMSEADILGLSTALTSVGIEAEMGGSAISKAMVRMQLASTSGFTGLQEVLGKTGMTVRELQMMASHSGKAFGHLAEDMGMTKKELNSLLTAGVDLENFGKIAGMTGEEFKTAFEKDAVGALGAFINGLGTAEEAGDSAINMLQEMGISEVRLRDALLRAGNASELFAGAVDLSNESWEENNALTNEAAQRYATTASQLETFKNKMVDLGITLGGIIIPVLLKIVEAIEPWIEKFAELSKSSQKTILVIAGIAAAIGPVLVVVGALVSSVGAIMTAFGTASMAIAVVTTGVASAVPGVGALAAVFTALTGPIGIAIAAIAGIGIGVGLLVNHLSKDAIPEVDRFGTGVSEATQKALGSFFELSDGASQSLMDMSIRNTVVTGEMASSMIDQFNAMNTQILEGLNTNHAERMAATSSFFLNSSVLTDEEEAKILQKQENNHTLDVLLLESKNARIAEIMNAAKNAKRDLTEAEAAEINNIKDSMNKFAVKALSASEVEQKIIMEKMKQSAGDLSAQQAAEVVKNSAKQRNESVKEAEGQFDETVAEIIRMRDETGVITAEQATKMIAEATRAKDETVKHAENMHQDVVKEAQSQASGHIEQVNWETGEILSKWEVFKNKTKTVFSDIAKGIQDGWNKAWTWTKEKVQSIMTSATEKFEEMKKAVGDKMTEVKTKISEKWDEAMKFFKNIDLKQIGKDIIQGLVDGITDKMKVVADAIKGITDKIKGAFKKEMETASPSKVMIRSGKDVGDGIAIGITSTEGTNQKAIEGVAKVLSTAAKKNAEEITKIATEAEKKRTEVQADFAKKRAELGRKSNQSSQTALKTSKNKKGEIVTTGTQRVHNIRADASSKLTKLNEDEQKKLASINEKAWKDMQKKEAEISKARLESVKTYVADKKSLDELSLVAESEVWRKSLALFQVGTKERVEIQKAYQASLKAINDEVIKVNDEYASKMMVINDRLRKEEEDLTNMYTKSVDDRAKALESFANTFDLFEIKLEKSGADLLTNLSSQVNAFKLWQLEIEKLSNKAIDDGLIAELREMGPKALPELLALNSLTGEQLTQYSALYQEKSKLARTQAEAELIGMKTDTKKRIDELRVTANTELEALRGEWTTKIQSITKATDDELKSLKQIGVNAGQGLLDGLASMEGSLVAKARSIAQAVSAAMASALQVKSPSRVTMKIGQFVGEGLEVGMENSIASIKNAARAMASAAVPNVAAFANPQHGGSMHPAIASSGINGGDTYTGPIYVNIDGKDFDNMRDITDFFSHLKQVTRKN